MLTKAILIGSMILPIVARAQERTCNNRPDGPGAIAFFHGLQSAVQKNDRQAIAGMIDYPVRGSLQHKSVRVRSTQELLAHFDEIFNKGVHCSILGASETDVWGTGKVSLSATEQSGLMKSFLPTKSPILTLPTTGKSIRSKSRP
jgi:hypothetical protein